MYRSELQTPGNDDQSTGAESEQLQYIQQPLNLAMQSLSTPINVSSLGLTNGMIERSLSFFFQQLHHLPVFSFIHRPSLLQRYKAGLLDPTLLLAIYGVAGILDSDTVDDPAISLRCISAAESSILGSYSKPSIIKIQALVFVIKFKAFTADYSGMFMLMSLALRMAMALRLNYESKTGFLAKESRRRLMWSLFLTDTKLAAGYRDFTLCPIDLVESLQLPCHDRSFELGLPNDSYSIYITSGDHHHNDLSPLALNMKVAALRDGTLKFTKHVSQSTSGEGGDIIRDFQTCHEAIEALENALPQACRLTTDNICLKAHLPEFGCFVATHIVLQSCHLILQRLAVPHIKEGLPPAVLDALDPAWMGRRRSDLFSATQKMANIFKEMLNLGSNLRVVDIDVPVCAYQCARMLMYMQQDSFGASSTITSTAAKSVEHCVELVRQLPWRYPALDAIVSSVFLSFLPSSLTSVSKETYSRWYQLESPRNRRLRLGLQP